jgi:hypothetical protein
MAAATTARDVKCDVDLILFDKSGFVHDTKEGDTSVDRYTCLVFQETNFAQDGSLYGRSEKLVPPVVDP